MGGLSTYKTGQETSVIVMFTDAFGHTYANNQRVADTISRANYLDG